MLILYVIAEMRLAWQANVGSNWKLWEEVRYIWHIEGEDSDTEEESPKVQGNFLSGTSDAADEYQQLGKILPVQI